MVFDSIWITGPSCSGKTTRLVEQFCRWADEEALGATAATLDGGSRDLPVSADPGIWVFAANGDSRMELADRIAIATQGKHPGQSVTPLGFFQEEVRLFWPLLLEVLNLRAQFPLRLRPENEQELATRLWQAELTAGWFRMEGANEYRTVRRLLDWLQLAAFAGIPLEDIPQLLQDGFSEQALAAETCDRAGEAILHWRDWCLARGLLTYGIIAELYWRHLLPHPIYQQQLLQRVQAIIADDTDEYPAIAGELFEFLLQQGVPGAFTYNPDGAIRLGLNADPDYLAKLAAHCSQVETLADAPVSGLAAKAGSLVTEMVSDPTVLAQLPDSIQSLQTTSRRQLLRQTALQIADAVKAGQVLPQEIAIIAPGLDAIARYALAEILSKQGITIELLNDQRPLVSLPIVRALLTLLALVYPGLGRLVDRDAVAEMLVLLSQPSAPTRSQFISPAALLDDPAVATDAEDAIAPTELHPTPQIDPVRAGLLADACFDPHPNQPRLLPANAFPRWDRLGHIATTAYESIRQWVVNQQTQLTQRALPSPVALLDRAMQHFLLQNLHLPYDQLATLRALVETAQQYWQVDARLNQGTLTSTASQDAIHSFIQLLRSGTVTADPFPTRPLGSERQAVTLATIFQYRSSRRRHRWQFWLDAGSPLWFSGGAAVLFGAPCFLRSWSGRPLTVADKDAMDEERLRRILLDLLSRADERVYLCHSDLATNGQEQMGPLLSLIDTAVPVAIES